MTILEQYSPSDHESLRKWLLEELLEKHGKITVFLALKRYAPKEGEGMEHQNDLFWYATEILNLHKDLVEEVL